MSGIWITWISSEGWRHSKQKHQSQAPAEHFCSRAEKIRDIHKRLERTRLPFPSLFLTQSAVLLNNVSPGLRGSLGSINRSCRHLSRLTPLYPHALSAASRRFFSFSLCSRPRWAQSATKYWPSSQRTPPSGSVQQFALQSKVSQTSGPSPVCNVSIHCKSQMHSSPPLPVWVGFLRVTHLHPGVKRQVD